MDFIEGAKILRARIGDKGDQAPGRTHLDGTPPLYSWCGIKTPGKAETDTVPPAPPRSGTGLGRLRAAIQALSLR